MRVDLQMTRELVADDNSCTQRRRIRQIPSIAALCAKPHNRRSRIYISFIFAMIAVKGLLKFIASHSYAVFAWYRIAFGLVILATWQFGWIDWTAVKP